MKKRIAFLLAAAMLLLGLPAPAEEASLENLITLRGVDTVEDAIGVQAGEVLVVGSSTELSGYFATDMWGTNTADMDVRKLLHGYSTVSWLRMEGVLFNGTAVAGSYVRATSTGNREYIISLMTDLTYNDGTPITAKDYVFSLLLSCSSEVAEIGGNPRGLEHLDGYEAYKTGGSNSFAGVKLVSDDTFILEIKADFLPNFYGLAMLDVTPYPMHVIAPGCDVFDDGDGAYIGPAADAGSVDGVGLPYVPGEFSAEMLQETLLDPETGYVYNPQVTSGPYSLESYDSESHVATLVVNPEFQGNYEGQKPHIERLVFRKMDDETMLDDLISGEFGLLNKVSDRGIIERGMELTTDPASGFLAGNYLRSGLAFLGFACELGPTQYPAVRKAIAHCIDRDRMLYDDAGGYGMLAHGYYGLGQWMASFAAEEDAQAGLRSIDAAVERETLSVPFDVEAAKALLVSDGWTLNETGESYDEAADSVRYRDIDGLLTPLTVRWAKAEDNATADLLETILEPALAQAGIGLEVDTMSFGDMLTEYYRQTDRTHHLFFLGTNFLNVFDPYYEYNTGDAYQGLVNTSGLRDEELMALAQDMRQTNQMDLHSYAIKWMAFQTRWAELMPMAPLYSNVYFDFYANTLHDYDITLSASWAEAILYASIGEPITEVEEKEEDVVISDEAAGEEIEPAAGEEASTSGEPLKSINDV